MENKDDAQCTGPVEKRPSVEVEIISSGQKWMIINYYKSLISETNSMKHHQDMMKHISKTLGIDLSCVNNTISDYKRTKTVVSPSRKRNRSENRGEIGSFDKHVFRKMVYSFWEAREIPTIHKLLSAINRDDSLPNTNIRSLRTTLNSLNFRYNNRKLNFAVLERGSLVAWRSKYLRSIRKFREEKRPIYYLGETFFDTNEYMVDDHKPFKKVPSESSSSGSFGRTNGGKKFIILHIGSSDGFLPGGLWCMETKKNSSNYRDGIKTQNLNKWFKIILPLLKDNAVIVLGNENYQSEKIENIPTYQWKKRDVVEWLSSKGEEVDPEKHCFVQLMEIVKRIKPKFDKYFIDEIAKENGKTVHRLPPFHTEFNAIELVWPLLKQHMASKATLDIELIHPSVESFDINHWETCISHTIEAEQKMWDMDFICDDVIDQLIESRPKSGLSSGDDSSDASDFDDDKLIKH